MHQGKVKENKNNTYLNWDYKDIDHIRPIPIQEIKLPIVKNHINYSYAKPNKILKTAEDFNKKPNTGNTLRFADKVEVIPRLNLGEVSYEVKELNEKYQLYDKSEDHQAETEQLQLKGNRRKKSPIYEFKQCLSKREIQCGKLFNANISVDEKLKVLSNIQAQYPLFYYNKPELFEAYRQYIQKTHRYINAGATYEDVNDHLSGLIEKCNTIQIRVNSLNKGEFVPSDILEDVWDTFNALRDFQKRWGFLNDLDLNDNEESPTKEIRDMINNRREGIENCISILEEDLISIRDIDEKHYAKLQSEELKKFYNINLDIRKGFMYDDLLKAQGIVQNVMNMYNQITRKYRSCFKDDSKFGYLYTDWGKFYKAINSGQRTVMYKNAFNYEIEASDFDSDRRHESLDDYKNYSGIKLLKSIQYVEDRLKKIQYLIKKYSMNIDDRNEDAYWGNQTVYYSKIRDDLLEMQWDHYIKQKDNYKNYERLFNECLDNDIGPMRLGIMRVCIMRNTVIYSILRIQKLFPNVLSSNDEENEFWKAQEKKYMWKKSI